MATTPKIEVPTSPTTAMASPESLMPVSPRSQLDAFLDENDDVLQWTDDWEQRSTNMDRKHVEVLSSHWQLMRESAKEHSQLIHHMKKALYEMRANGLTLQDRLDALEFRLREDMGKESGHRVDDLERRLRERLRQESAEREAEIAELRDLLRGSPEDLEARLEARLASLERRLGERLQQEQDARESEVSALRDLASREPEQLGARLGDIEQRVREERAAREADVSELQKLVGDEPAKLRARVEDLENLLAQERAAREALESLLAKERAAREATARDAEALVAQEQAAREAACQALDELVAQEKLAREADVRALKDLSVDEPARLQARLQEVEDLVAQERSAREVGLRDVGGLVAQEKADREASLDAMQALLEREGEVLRGLKQFLTDESEQRTRGEAELQERAAALEQALRDLAEQHSTAGGALRDELLAEVRRREQARRDQEEARRDEDARVLDERFTALDNRLDEALRGVSMEEIVELVASERLARETDLANLQQAVEQEFNEHVARLEALKASLAAERPAIEQRLSDVQHALQDQLEQQQLSIQGRVEHLLRILQESSGRMVDSWRDADGAAGHGLDVAAES